jgi:hypothetical protein
MELKDISGLAITLLVTAIVIGLMATVLGSFQGNMKDSQSFSPNRTLVWAGNNTGIDLGEKRISAGSVVLWNNNTLVNQGNNYSIVGSSIVITNISGLGGNLAGWRTDAYNVSFNYLIGSVAYNSSTYGLNTTNTISSYLPLIGLISIAAVIVGIVLVMFFRKKQV